MRNQMSQREIALFNLGKSLVALLGEEQAIADLTLLYERHPEMFRDKEEVREVIDRVVSAPEIVIHNPRARSEKDFIAARQLDDEKMADVGIRNDNGTNVIYHANKINAKKMKQFERKAENQLMVGTPNSYTQAQSLDERLVQKNISSASKNPSQVETPTLSTHQLNGWGLMGINPNGANALSATKKQQILVETPSAEAAPTWSDHCADKSNDLPKGYQAPSVSAPAIIPHPTPTNTPQAPESNQEPCLQESLQKAIDTTLKSYLTSQAPHTRQKLLDKANALYKRASECEIVLDPASLKRLRQYNIAAQSHITKGKTR